MGLFQNGADRLVAAGLRLELRRGHGPVAIYPEKIPLQPGLPVDRAGVCLRHDCCMACLRREHSVCAMDRSGAGCSGLYAHHKVIC